MANTIKIGHASISEYGTAYGDAGDSTSREVYIIENYNISNIDPYIVLRPKKSAIAEASVAACIAGCENNNIGYSQSSRNTLYNLAKENNFDLSQVGLCNTDCSAFMTVCAIAGGAKITYGSNAPTTSNMRTRFTKSGDYEVLTSSKYTDKTDYLKAGDILVHEGVHTVMVLENGSESQTEPDEPETTKSLQSYNIITNVTKLAKNTATINIKTTSQLNELETIIGEKSWTYTLEYKQMPAGAISEQEIKDNKVELLNLTEDTCYGYRIKVKNGSTELFCSAYKTFNTLKDSQNQDLKITTSTGYIDSAYIKEANEYKPVVIHINN